MRRGSAKVTVESGSGNVFADLGLHHPEQELLKSRLTLQIYRLIRARGLKQAEARKILGIKQPHVSSLMRKPVGHIFGGASYGVSHCAWAGCGDHRETYA